MNTKSTKVSANIQFGIGIILILIAVSGLTHQEDYLLGIGILFLGGGNILAGFSHRNTDETPKGKKFLYMSAALQCIGSAIIIYHSYFSVKK